MYQVIKRDGKVTEFALTPAFDGEYRVDPDAASITDGRNVFTSEDCCFSLNLTAGKTVRFTCER